MKRRAADGRGSERREVDSAIGVDSLRGDHWRELRLGVTESLLLRGLLLQCSEDSLRLQLVVHGALYTISARMSAT